MTKRPSKETVRRFESLSRVLRESGMTADGMGWCRIDLHKGDEDKRSGGRGGALSSLFLGGWDHDVYGATMDRLARLSPKR
jgi:hypothetical protein